MDELPIILISNDLKYAMTSLKIKTFQRARQYYYTQRQAVESGHVQTQQLVGISDKLQKIKKYMQKYNTVRQDVWNKVQFCHLNDNQQEEDHQLNVQKTQTFLFPQRQIYVPRYDDSSDEELQFVGSEKPIMPQSYQFAPQTKNQTLNSNNNTNNLKEQDLNNNSRYRFDFDLSKQNLTSKQQWDRPQVKKAKRQSFLLQSSNNKQSNTIKHKNLFEKSIIDSSIVEIYGQKSVGKTALLLYFCQQYAQSSTKKIYFINCGGGVTQKRFERLHKNCSHLQYRDSYILDHVLAVCKSAALDPNTGCIALDSLTNLLMQQEKTLIFLIKMFKIFSYLLNKGCKVILTNYLQQTFDHHEDDPLTNHYSYYCAVTSQFLTYKYFLNEIQNSAKVAVKMCRGGFVEAEFDICENGVNCLDVKQGEREI